MRAGVACITLRAMPSLPTPPPAAAPPLDVPRFRAALLDWYGRHRRELPWRAAPDAYRVWISEIMLQQTTVRSMLPYYERFLAGFPDVRALAAAPLDDVLARWSGLGYYSRARNLHRAAQMIVAEHGGTFPRELAAALALPGIGRYTAAAILSIACDRPHAVLDGNVVRVLARLDVRRGNPKSTAMQKALWARAQELLAPDRPGDFNQAMMELGATVCTPRSPRCAACPVAFACGARWAGLTAELPETAPRTAPVDETRAVFVFTRAGRILFRQRPEDAGLMPGLWELPDLLLVHGEGGLLIDRAALQGRLAEAVHPSARPGARLGEARHSIMNRRIRLEVFEGRLRREFQASAPWRWLDPGEIGEIGTSSIVRKVLRLRGDNHEDDADSE